MADLQKRGPYGHVLAQAVREELTAEAIGLGGSVRELRGYAYAVLNGHVLFPYRYADHPLALDRARLPADASYQRRRMLTAHGPEADAGLFPLEDVAPGEEHLRLHEAFEELGATTRLVSVFFTASKEEGVHQIHWGEARLESDRTFSWPHRETLLRAES
ncbi:hypothetical protein [Streptomyces fradiae]|uniref:hypothetical protein n=1 Tax=Streptomyces fradiae TaxID=1906 RepID=UPI0038151903